MCAVAGAIAVIAVFGLLVYGLHAAAERCISDNAGDED